MTRTFLIAFILGLLFFLTTPRITHAFVDVPKAHWDENWGFWVDKMQSEGFMEGFPDARFQPNALMTRYELAKVLSRVVDSYLIYKGINNPLLAEVMNSTASGPFYMPFNDIPKDHWAYEDVMKLENLGILAGFPGSKFDGNEPVRREDFVAVIACLLNILEKPYVEYNGSTDKDEYIQRENAVKERLESRVNDLDIKQLSGITRLDFCIIFAQIWDMML
jgi:hypothetical protein